MIVLEKCNNNRKSSLISLILLFGLLFLPGICNALSIEPPKITPLEVTPVLKFTQERSNIEWEGHISDQKEEFIRVVVTKEEWVNLWRRAFDKPAPEVDFENYSIASVFLGHSARWLYHIGFDKPYERDNLLVIPYGLAEIILKLSGPFNVIFQLHSPVTFSGAFPRCSTLCWIF